MYVCLYIYIYIYVCIYVHIYTHTHTQTHTHLYMCVYVYLYVCVCIVLVCSMWMLFAFFVTCGCCWGSFSHAPLDIWSSLYAQHFMLASLIVGAWVLLVGVLDFDAVAVVRQSLLPRNALACTQNVLCLWRAWYRSRHVTSDGFCGHPPVYSLVLVCGCHVGVCLQGVWHVMSPRVSIFSFEYLTLWTKICNCGGGEED